MTGSLAFAAPSISEIAKHLSEARILPGTKSFQVFDLPEEVIITITLDSTFTDEDLNILSTKIAQSMLPDQATGKQTVLVFDNSQMPSKVRAVLLSGEQVKAALDKGNPLDPNSLVVWPGEVSVTKSSQPNVVDVNAAVSEFQMLKNRVTSRIQALKGKGVGVKLFLDEVARADDFAKRSDWTEATAVLDHLNSSIDSYEKQYKQQQLTLKTGLQKSDSLVHATNPGSKLPVGKPSPSQPPDFGQPKYPVGTDPEEKEIIKLMWSRVGDLAPYDGPFRLERFQLAQRIVTLRQAGTNVDNYLNLYRRLEDIVKENDPRKVRDISGEIEYLQKQLGIR